MMGRAAYAGGGGVPTTGAGSLKGPTTVCAGDFNTYTLEEGFNICFSSGSFAVQGGTIQSGQTTTEVPHDVIVQWTNNTTAPITGRILYSQAYYDVECDFNKAPKISDKDLFVTINPNPSSVNIGSSVGLVISGQDYIFSTTSSNAVGFNWNVSGGSIQGNASGSSIRVRPTNGSCQLSVSVRAFATNCAGNTINSAQRSRTVNIPVPGRPGNIQGPQYVGAQGDFKNYSVTPGANATSHRWYFAPGAQFLFGGNTTGPNITIFSNTNSSTASTVSVVAKTSCGESAPRSKTITGGTTPPFGRGVAPEELPMLMPMEDTKVYPSPAKLGDAITIEVPALNDVVAVRILDIQGRLISNLTPAETTEVSLADWEPGLYIVQTVRQQMVSTVQFSVE